MLAALSYSAPARAWGFAHWYPRGVRYSQRVSDTAQGYCVEVPGPGPEKEMERQMAAANHGQTHPYGYIHRKDDYLKRLRRIEGQARGLQKMVEDEKYCIDILTQVSAMTKALQSVALGLLDEHLSHCVVEAAAAGGPEADEKIREASEAIARLVRS